MRLCLLVIVAVSALLVGCSPKPQTPESKVQAMQNDMAKAQERIKIMKDAFNEAENKSKDEAQRIIRDAQQRADAIR